MFPRIFSIRMSALSFPAVLPEDRAPAKHHVD
jgi:hypothetical protein